MPKSSHTSEVFPTMLISVVFVFLWGRGRHKSKKSLGQACGEGYVTNRSYLFREGPSHMCAPLLSHSVHSLSTEQESDSLPLK